MLAQWAHALEVAFHEEHTQADAVLQDNTTAATRIQKHWRGFKTRKEADSRQRGATLVQAGWRGIEGRRYFGQVQRTKAREDREAFFHAAAIAVQKRWRGHISRKYVHDFRAMKQYLAAVAGANAQQRATAEQQMSQLQEQLQAEDEEAVRAAFHGRCQGRHYLLSTAVAAGVFNSPYGELLGGLPAFEGVLVEQHLRNTRANLQMPKMTKENPKAQYVTSARTMNAESSYYAVRDAVRDRAVYDRVMDIGRAMGAPQPFMTAVHTAPFGRTGLAMPGGSMSTGTLYSSELTRATRRREGDPDPNLPDTAIPHPRTFRTAVSRGDCFEDNIIPTRKVCR